MSDLKTVREALELGNAAIDYEAGYRVMDAGLAALSRLEAQQEMGTTGGREGWPGGSADSATSVENGGQEQASSSGFESRRLHQDSPQAAPPVEPCPKAKALALLLDMVDREHLVADAVADCRATSAFPCSPCPRCAEMEDVVGFYGNPGELVQVVRAALAKRDRLREENAALKQERRVQALKAEQLTLSVKALVEGLRKIRDCAPCATAIHIGGVPLVKLSDYHELQMRASALVAEHADKE